MKHKINPHCSARGESRHAILLNKTCLTTEQRNCRWGNECASHTQRQFAHNLYRAIKCCMQPRLGLTYNEEEAPIAFPLYSPSLVPKPLCSELLLPGITVVIQVTQSYLYTGIGLDFLAPICSGT